MGRKKNVGKSTEPTNDTPFRRWERYWKGISHNSNLQYDLSAAFDPDRISWASDDVNGTVEVGERVVECKKVFLDAGLMGESGLGQASWKGKEKRDESSFAIVLPSFPGFVLLPRLLPPALQRALVKESLEHSVLPNLTSLSPHYDLPPEGLWKTWVSGGAHDLVPRIDLPPPKPLSPGVPQRRVKVDFEPVTKENWKDVIARGRADGDNENLSGEAVLGDSGSVEASGLEGKERFATIDSLLSKLRWTNIGFFYDWTSKCYDFSKGEIAIPPLINQLCRSVVAAVPWDNVFPSPTDERDRIWKDWRSTYKPEAGIINFYQLKDSLTAHVDQSEIDPVRPLVSFSPIHGW